MSLTKSEKRRLKKEFRSEHGRSPSPYDFERISRDFSEDAFGRAQRTHLDLDRDYAEHLQRDSK